jgi:glutamine---fructose-6-phosphate transaminase (isomerizing)
MWRRSAIQCTRHLNNTLFRFPRRDPESGKDLVTLDSGLRRYDDLYDVSPLFIGRKLNNGCPLHWRKGTGGRGKRKTPFFALRGWNLFLGRDPGVVPPRSIIFFPRHRATFFCGLAGLLAIRGSTSPGGKPPAPETLSEILNEMRNAGLEAILNGSSGFDGYLGGQETLSELERLATLLKDDDCFRRFMGDADALAVLRTTSAGFNELVRSEESLLDCRASQFSTDRTERLNEALSRLRDVAWSLEQDLLGGLDRAGEILRAVGFPAGENVRDDTMDGARSLDLLLSAVDRLEIRGRDSAGLEIFFEFDCPEVELRKTMDAAHLSGQLERRSGRGDSEPGSLFIGPGGSGGNSTILSLVYKTASVSGELGENTTRLKKEILSDPILARALEQEVMSRSILAHTRWASVGSITLENCHPVNNHVVTCDSRETLKEYPYYGRGNWTIDVALNGDVDNYRELLETFRKGRRSDISRLVTTDAKIIPLQIERHLEGGCDLEEAFRLAMLDFEGSQAVAMQSNLEPGKVFLALRGSGQSLYVGLCDDCYFYASEIYGFVERTSRFIRLDGETEQVPGDPRSRGQIVVLDGRTATVRGRSFNGEPLYRDADITKKAEITTRDIDRKGHPHFLLKEILDAPESVRKTLRGKYRIDGDCDGKAGILFNLGDDVISPRLRQALVAGDINNIIIIGQGTAAVAGAAMADAFKRYLDGTLIRIRVMRATELSGFDLKDNLEDTLVIAVTQSGTTTDTNRAVAMARERKAHLMAVVNRRQSDITGLVDGVFYTSDGRDIEMSVASTKAFYSQVVAGYVLAVYCAHTLGRMDDVTAVRILLDLERCPGLMESVIERRDGVKQAAERSAKRKRYWALVGSGPNKVAADEVRIKLSELCYKTISSDYVEDKKHIDLSSEPLVLVLTAGNPGPVVDDIVKDVAIFKAHAADVVVVADEGETRFRGVADSVITVPHADYPGAVILNTLAGHLWGYYAARAIDAEACFLREFRGALAKLLDRLNREGLGIFEKTGDEELHHLIDDFASVFRERLSRGCYGSLDAEAAADLSLLLKYATGRLPVELYRADFKDRTASPSPLDQLDITLGKAIDELARPIDAIRHQAKTVTVGTSRREDMPRGVIFDLAKSLGFGPENLAGRNGPALRNTQIALRAVRGYMLYRVGGLDFEGKPRENSTLSIAGRGGVAKDMTSRVERDNRLMGTKKTIVSTGKVYAGRGKSDGAELVIVPLLGDGPPVESLLLMHVDFHDQLPLEQKKDVLGEKYEWIQDHVSEYNISWSDDMLEPLSPFVLMEETAEAIADIIISSVENRGGP